jgi:hypothetical protein
MDDFISAAVPARLANLEYNQTLVNRNFLQAITSIIELSQPRIAKSNLIRVGQNADGGYVISPEFHSYVCLNLGVGYEVTADIDLIQRGFEIFAFDGTVPNPLPEETSYHFHQKNIGYEKKDERYINLQRIFQTYFKLQNLDVLLIDIEGHEYKILERELNFVTQAKQIVVEFHGLELLGDEQFSERLVSILNKLMKSHYPIHIHANNAGGVLPIGGASWPTILEITFLAKEYCSNVISFGPFPTALDFPNTLARPDVDLTPFYGMEKNYASLARTVLGLP